MMKKIAKLLGVIFIFAFAALYSSKNAYAASATLTGPDTVRAGDTITLKLNVNDNGKLGFDGELSYNSALVSFSSVSTDLKEWIVEKNDNKLVIYDNTQENALNGTKTVITLKFKVSANAKAGDKIQISVNGLTSSDGTNENTYPNVSYSVNVAQPLSANANLSALSVDGVTITPAFNADTTTYNGGEVEFATSKVNVKYTAADAKANVKVSGTNLAVGKNKVTVTVTAENGTKKTYTVNITRKQDPNYVANNDATLKELTVSNGSVSPAFSKDVTDYVVYLPYEFAGKSITASGKANNNKASGVTAGKLDSLAEGTNELKVVCKAEDGTEKIYNVTVVVMPKYAGALPNIEGVEVNGDIEKPTIDVEKPTEPEETTTIFVPLEEEPSKGVSPVVIIILVIVAAAMGFAGCYLLFSQNLLR